MLNFNPKKVAYFEVQAWQAHHYGQKIKLVYFLLRHQMELFGIHSWQAVRALQLLVPAIQAHNRSEKVMAENYLASYYSLIKKIINYPFNTKVVASREASWWWIHDDLEHIKDKTPLVNAFATLYAAILSVPVETAYECGKLRTEATIFHDLAESKNTPQNTVAEYWSKTERSLVDFYTELLRVDRLRK